MKRVLVGCECSGRVREALRRRGVDAWSCDTQPSEDGSPYHIHDDLLAHLDDGWDGAIMHPECTRLTNAGVRWLKVPPAGRTFDEMWEELEDACRFYLACRDAPIPKKVIENPIMHRYARIRIKPGPRQIVQPHHFGDPFLKATGFELINVPPLVRTHWMDPPTSTKEPERYRQWAQCHHARPTRDPADRARERSRTYPGIADALADAMVRALEEPELKATA